MAKRVKNQQVLVECREWKNHSVITITIPNSVGDDADRAAVAAAACYAHAAQMREADDMRDGSSEYVQ